MEMLEKSIDLWKRSNSHRYIKILYYYIISEHRKRVLVVYRIISGLAASCYATKYQFNSFILLLLSTGGTGNARTCA
jgi:hypothetical protein